MITPSSNIPPELQRQIREMVHVLKKAHEYGYVTSSQNTGMTSALNRMVSDWNKEVDKFARLLNRPVEPSRNMEADRHEDDDSF